MKRIERPRVRVLLTGLAVIATGVLALAPPASAATVGLAPSHGSPVQVAVTALRGDALALEIVNSGAGAVHVVEVSAQTTDADLATFEVSHLISIDPSLDVAAEGSFLAALQVYALHAGEHTGTLRLCDRLVSEPDGASHCSSVPVQVSAAKYGPAVIELSGPGQATAGATVTLSGFLGAPDGRRTPLAGATVTVTRSSEEGDADLPSVVTDAQGAFTIVAAVAESTTTFGAHFESADYTAWGAFWNVYVPAAASTITMTAPATAARGSTIHVTGALTSDGKPLASRLVSITTRTLQGTTTATVTTSAAGAFAVDRTLTVGGDVAVTAAWAGDAGHAAATRTVHVTVPRAATTMTLTSSKPLYNYGATATIRAHLGTTYNSRVVSVYERPLATVVGKPGNLIARVAVNSAGDLVLTRTLTRRTTYTAVFAGDYRYAPVTRTVSPNVRSKVTVTMQRWTKRSGKYYRYHKVNPVMSVAVRPLRPGTCLSAVAQVYTRGAWRVAARSSCISVDGTSTAHAVLITKRPIGVKYRVRFTVHATTWCTSATSAWRYFTFY